MFKFTKIVTLVIILISTNLVCSDNSAQNESEKVEENSVKTKRGIHGFGYPIYGHGTPYTYARFPTFYTLSPGKAIVHSFNVNYPKPFIRPAIPPPVLYHPKPILSLPSVPIYGNRYPYSYPTIVHKPIVSIPTAPHFSTSAFAPAIPQHINPIAVHQPTLVSQDGWTPISSSVPNVQHTHYNPPSVTVLPPLNPTHQQQTPNNYYLPPSSSGQQDISFTQPSGNCSIRDPEICVENKVNLSRSFSKSRYGC